METRKSGTARKAWGMIIKKVLAADDSIHKGRRYAAHDMADMIAIRFPVARISSSEAEKSKYFPLYTIFCFYFPFGSSIRSIS